MKTKLFITALTFMFITTVSAKKINEVNEVNGFQNPESVLAYKDYLFVSNTGEKLEPLAKDGDGYISMLSRKDGKVVLHKFISGLNAPKGMFVRRGVLYVADVDKVQGYDIDTKEKVFEANLADHGATYVNDITRGRRGMYVSSTLTNSIYKVKYNGDIKPLEVKGTLNGVNGLYRRRVGKLSVANYGRENEPNGSFGKIGLVTKKYKEYTKIGAFDGIVRKNGKLYVSDWVNNNTSEDNGRIIMYRNNVNKGFYEVNVGSSINGPSDIYIDKRTRLMWIPAMQENKLVAVPFEILRKSS